MSSSFLREEREDGFSLVELLVVIVIIGILSSISIAAFSNQRQKANDAAVKADMRTTITEIETILVDFPGNFYVNVYGEIDENMRTIQVTGNYTPEYKVVRQEIPGSDGVFISGHGLHDERGYATGYVLSGMHVNGNTFSFPYTAEDLLAIETKMGEAYDREWGFIEEIEEEYPHISRLEDLPASVLDELNQLSSESERLYDEYMRMMNAGELWVYDSSTGKFEKMGRGEFLQEYPRGG